MKRVVVRHKKKGNHTGPGMRPGFDEQGLYSCEYCLPLSGAQQHTLTSHQSRAVRTLSDNWTRVITKQIKHIHGEVQNSILKSLNYIPWLNKGNGE